MHIWPVFCIQVAELVILLSEWILQSYYYYLFYCLNKETWAMKLLSSWVASGQDWVNVFSKSGRVRNKLEQSITVSEKAILTTPSDAVNSWSAKWEQQAGSQRSEGGATWEEVVNVMDICLTSLKRAEHCKGLLSISNLFLVSNLNLPYCSLSPLLFALSTADTEKTLIS